MGVVYKARDTRLGRIVAIKSLTGKSLGDPGLKERFFQEARAASALNHPNIVTLYDVFSEGDTDYLVIEYVKGKTLEQLISSKPLHVRELLDYAVQIADALAVAHASGIIHRDLKPSNVMVTDDGRIKVLDFGLAKLAEEISSEQESTRTVLEQTAEGTIVGSARYMSPEQAEGKPVDARTDIFSLGAVLYEMCTGRKAFGSDSRVGTLAAVVTKDPAPIEGTAPETPRELRRVILRCLQKDPKRRFQSMLDLKLTLEELKADSDSGQLSGPQPGITGRRASRLPVAIAGGFVLVAIVAGALVWWRLHPRVRQPLALEQVTFDRGLTTNPAIAPDGKLIAYASDRAGEGNLDIWVQYRSGEPVRITRDPADEDEPAFSPDGTKIAFHSGKDGGGIYIVSSLGGEEARRIVNFGTRPRFSSDGAEILFDTGTVFSLSQVYRVDVRAMSATPVRVAPEFLNASMPLWSPDGRHILFVGSRLKSNGTETSAWVIARDGGIAEPVSVTQTPEIPITTIDRMDAWLPGDRILGEFAIRGRTHLFQARLHRNPWRMERFEQITFGTGEAKGASVAGDGTMVLSNEETDLDLWSFPFDANHGKIAGEAQRLTQDDSREAFASISEDGTKLAYSSELAGNVRVWLMELPSDSKRPLTAASRSAYRPVINLDGSQVAYRDQGPAGSPVFQRVSTSGSAPQRIAATGYAIWDWAPDGNALLVMNNVGPFYTTDFVDVADSRVIQFLKRPNNVFQTHISHDEHWAMAQESNVGLLMTRFDAKNPGNTNWQSVGLKDADLIRWSPDDNTIYFISSRDSFRCIWGQRLDPASKQLRGEPFAVAHFHQARRSLRITDTGEIGLAIARDKIVLSEAERTGNVWMTKLE